MSQATHNIDRAVKRKALLEERRKAALEDHLCNEFGENLDDLQDLYVKPLGLPRDPRDDIRPLSPMATKKQTNEINALRAAILSENEISAMSVSEGQREALEYVKYGQFRQQERAKITAREELGLRDVMRMGDATRLAEPCLNVCQGAVVRSAGFSSEGALFATGDQACEVRLWLRGKPGAVKPWRSGQVLKEHMAPITCVCFIPAGDLSPSEMIVTAAGDWTVRVWRQGDDGRFRAAGKIEVSHSAWVMDLCYLSRGQCARCGFDGPMLVSASGDKTLKVLLARPKKGSAPPPPPGSAAPEARGEDWTMELYEVATLRGHTDIVFAVTFSPVPFAGHVLLASAAVDWTVKIWRMATLGDASQWVCECSLMDATSGSTLGTPISFHPLVAGLLVTGYRQRVLVWDLEPGASSDDVVLGSRKVADLTGHVGDISGVAFRADGLLLASCDGDGEVRLWKESQHEEGDWVCLLSCSAGRRQGRALNFGRSTSEGLLLCCDEAGRVRMWDTGRIVPLLSDAERVMQHRGFATEDEGEASPQREEAPEPEPEACRSPGGPFDQAGEESAAAEVGVTGGRISVRSLAFAGTDGCRVLAAATYDEALVFWNVETFEETRRVYPHRGEPTCLAFLGRPKDSFIVAGGPGGFVKVVNVGPNATSQCANLRVSETAEDANAHRVTVRCLAASPDARTMVTASEDGELFIWDAKESMVVHKIEHGSRINRICYRPPGGDFFSVGGCAIKLPPERPGVLKEVPRLVGDNHITTYSIEHGETLPGRIAAHASELLDFCYSRDGGAIASCAALDTRVVVSPSDADAGGAPRVLQGHESEVRCVAYSRDGLLASADAGGAIRLWAADKYLPRGLLRSSARAAAIDVLAFSPDGALLAVAARDETVRVWGVDVPQGEERLLGTCRERGALMERVHAHVRRIGDELGVWAVAGGAVEGDHREHPEASLKDPFGVKADQEEDSPDDADDDSKADERTTRLYLQGKELATRMSRVGKNPPEEDLNAAHEWRKQLWRDRHKREADSELGMSNAELKRQARRKAPAAKEPPQPPITVAESRRRRGTAAARAAALMIEAAASCKQHTACVRALIGQMHSVIGAAKACACIALCLLGGRSEHMVCEEAALEAPREVLLAEANEREGALERAYAKLVALDHANHQRKKVYHQEARKAMQDKRRGRDRKQELDVEDWKASSIYRQERRKLLRELSLLLSAFHSSAAELKPLLALLQVVTLTRTLADPDVTAREASLCALAHLSARGDADVAEAVSHCVADPEPHVQRAAHLCLGVVGAGCMRAVAVLRGYALGELGDGTEAVRASALEGLAFVCRGRAGTALEGREELLTSMGNLVDGSPAVRAAALRVCGMLYRGDFAGLSHYDTNFGVVDKIPPFQESPFVPYERPGSAHDYRGVRYKEGRRGREPHTEPYALVAPPNRDNRTGREVAWPSEANRLYGESQINVKHRFAAFRPKERDPYAKAPQPGYGRLAMPPSPRRDAPTEKDVSPPRRGAESPNSKAAGTKTRRGSVESGVSERLSGRTSARRGSVESGAWSARSRGDSSARSRGDVSARSRGEVSARSRGDVSARSRGDVSARSRGDVLARSRGDESARSRGDVSARSRGDESARSRGDVSARSRGDESARSRGDVSARSRGDVSVRSRGDVSARSRGDVSARSSGSMSARSRGDMFARRGDMSARSTGSRGSRGSRESSDGEHSSQGGDMTNRSVLSSYDASAQLGDVTGRSDRSDGYSSPDTRDRTHHRPASPSSPVGSD